MDITSLIFEDYTSLITEETFSVSENLSQTFDINFTDIIICLLKKQFLFNMMKSEKYEIDFSSRGPKHIILSQSYDDMQLYYDF